MEKIITNEIFVRPLTGFEIFYHCRWASVVGRNQDCVISVVCNTCGGSSTETVAFQVYEILKIDHEFLQFFFDGIKNISV